MNIFLTNNNRIIAGDFILGKFEYGGRTLPRFVLQTSDTCTLPDAAMVANLLGYRNTRGNVFTAQALTQRLRRNEDFALTVGAYKEGGAYRVNANNWLVWLTDNAKRI